MAIIKPTTPLTAEAFKAEMNSRGWSALMLSQRWSMTKRRVDQIIADADRPRYYDDAVRALPVVMEG